MLLCIPVRGVILRLKANDGLGIVQYAILFLLYPVVARMSSVVAGKVNAGLSSHAANAANHPYAMHVAVALVNGAVIAVMLLAAFAVAAVVSSSLFRSFAMPAKVHRIVSYALEVFARILVFFYCVAFMRYCDGRFFNVSTAVKVLLVLAFGAAVVLSIRWIGKRGGPAGGSRTSEDSDAGADQDATRRIRVEKRPSVKFSDVIGMDDAKEQIRLRLVEPLRNPQKAKMYGLSVGGGVLLYGPPGTGKTMLARALAGELNLPFFMITSSDVFGKYVGESARNMRAIFAEIRKTPFSVVFIDELESLFPSRATDVHESTRKVISVLLQELDGLDKAKNPILLLGATNVPWMVDEAFLRPGRFDVCLYIGLPDFEARRYMMYRALDTGKVSYETGLDIYIARRTEGFSGADLKGFFEKMQQDAFKRRLPYYTCAQADELLASFEPSKAGDLIEHIKIWEKTRHANASSHWG